MRPRLRMSSRLLWASVTVSALALAAPALAQAAAPTGVTGIALDAGVELAWQPVLGAGGYAVYRGTSPTAITTRLTPDIGTTATTFTDTAAGNGTTYYYAVRAIEGGIESADSLVVQATPRARSCSSGNPIVFENCFPGDGGWRVQSTATVAAGGIEGFAIATSVNKGGSVGVKVNAAAGSSFRIEVYRSGAYGNVGGRHVSTIRGVPSTAQPACTTDAPTGLVDCSNWTTTATLTTSASWPSGVYLLRLVRDNGNDAHVLLVVRDDARTADVLYGVGVTDFQAYNNWGGKSLYDFNSSGNITVAGTARAVKVSFDRPYEQARNPGQRDWYTRIEYPMVAWLEGAGYDVAYVANTDLERDPGRLLSAQAYVSPAHDEYYSAGMRTALEQARDGGVGLFFTGSNEIYWKIRFENGGRTQVCYKTTQSGGADPSGIHTGTWRDPRGANRPENGLTGVMYVGDRDFQYFPVVVSAAEGKDRVYRYTGLDLQPAGTSTSIGTDLVGWEWDARVANGAEPAGVVTLASSPVTGSLIQGDGAFQTPGSTTSHMVKYTAASGALVVTTGTNHWARALGLNVDNVGRLDTRIQQITTNVLSDMGARPATPASGIVLDDASGRPPAPAGLTGGAIGRSVELSWSPVAGATGYNVYRSTTPRSGGLPLGTKVNAVLLSGTTFTESELAFDTTYFYVVTAVVLGLESAASNELQARTDPAVPFLVRINAGGPTYTTTGGLFFAADANFSGGQIGSTSSPITGTADPALYQNERWGQFSYAIAIANGNYDVRFHFAEIYYGTEVPGGAGKRVFGMDVLDTAASPDLANIDIYAAVGPRAALVRTVSGIAVSDGVLNIRSVYGPADDPEVTAIEVVPAASTPDAGPPAVSVTAPAAGATVSGTTSVTASASDDIAVAGVQFRLDGADLGAEDTGAPYSVSWDTTTATNGDHTLTAIARDAAGNRTTATAVTVTVDNSAPTVSLAAPAAGATVSATTSVTATAGDNVGVIGVQFRLDGADLGAEDTSAPYSVSWDTTTATNGDHALTAVARDAAGNRTTATAVTITVDNSSPTVSITAPAADATVSATTSVSATASDNLGVAGVQFRLDGVDLGAEDTTAPYSVSWDTTTAANGSHTLTAVARDGAGNRTTATAVTVTVDNAAPTVSITAPAGGATLSGATSVSATASDNLGVAGVQFRLDGADLGVENTSAPYSVSWDTTTATNGEHTLTAIARDAAGNRTTATAVTLTVDNSTPTVSITAPAAGATVSATTTVTATAGDNVGVIGVQFRLDGADLGAEDTTAPYSLSWDTTTATNGSHTLTAVARDGAGNRSTAAAVTVTVDNAAPTVSITAPAAEATVSATTGVSATASDNLALAGVQFRLDGADLGAEDTTAPYSVSWDTTTAGNGSHTLTAIARDTAGNRTTATAITVTVQNATAPPPVGTSTVRINAGGPAYTTAGGLTFSADANFTGGSTWSSTSAITGSSDPALYQNERWGQFSYAVPVANGTYDVRFHFAELYYGTSALGGPGSRVFGMDVVDTLASPDLQNIDIYAAVGPRAALVRTVAGVTVTDGVLNVRSVYGPADDPEVTAIEVVPAASTPGDTAAPTVSVTAPAAGATVSATASVTASASDDVGVAGVQFRLDGADLGAEDTSAPYSVSWDTTTAANGSHTLTAVARDAAGNRTTSAAVTVTVQNGAPDTSAPTVSVTAPAADATVSATTSVSASASDDVGVAGVQFRLDGADLGAEDTSAPYSVSWDTTTAANGSHTLTAVARDAAGNRTTSAAVTVTVQNSATPPPPGTSTVRINVGGPAYTAVGGSVFASDANFAGGSTYAVTGTISGTSDPALYQNERWGQFSYAIPVANGTYDVRLHFAELYYGTAVAGGAGKRVFGMDVLDTLASPDLQNIDVYAEVGPRAALVKTVGAVTVSDGVLDIRSVYGPVDDPEMTAIEVVPADSAPPDATPPAVTVTSPAAGATVTGTTTVSATASDSVGVVGIQFRLDGVDLGVEDTSAPYSVSWDTTTASNGSHTVSAVGRDAAGNRTTASVAVVVDNAPPPPDTTAPSVSITAPAAGATVSGATSVSASASDDVGVAGVQFRLDGVDLGAEDTSAPYSVSWDTFTAANGSHTLTAIARDAAGNRTTSADTIVTVSNVIVSGGLVAAYGFGEGSGLTVADASGNGNIGTISGAAFTTQGKFGSALSFDGTNDWVTVADSPSLDLSQAMTLSAWVNPTSLSSAWSTVVVKETADYFTYALYANTDSNRPSVHAFTSADLDTNGTTQLPFGVWTHLAATWDGATLRLYVNGAEVSSRAVSGTMADSAGPLRLGGNAVWGEWLRGRLDEVRIYNRALSPAEIQSDMNRAVG